MLKTALLRNAKLNLFYERAKKIEPCDAAHDFSHIERVAKLAISIYRHEIRLKLNREINESEIDDIAVAALLHDCVPVPKNSPLRKEASRLASEKAREWLIEANWPSESIGEICLAIRDHSYSAGYTPSSLMGECLQDADRLESLGALGLYRTIATGVAMGCTLFDANDPWAKNRELNDQKFSIDHFYNKLLKLPAGFRTPSARIEAEKRADFLRAFARQLAHEID